MAYFLMFTSVCIEVLKNIYLNHFGKDCTKTPRDAYLFNAVSSFGSLLLLICIGAQFKISTYSILMAVCFAFISAVAQFSLLMSMSCGSMSYSVLFSALGLLIPTSYGMICGQKATFYQIAGLFLMLLTLYLGIGAKNDSKITVKWIVFSTISFVSWGTVGLIQVLHQSSPYKSELNGFLIWSFLFMVLLFSVMYLCSKRKQDDTTHYAFKSKDTIFILIAGLFVGATNKINLYLSGILPSIILFPILNGGAIILSGIASVLLFKEKLTKAQKLGVVTGIISICLLGI